MGEMLYTAFMCSSKSSDCKAISEWIVERYPDFDPLARTGPRAETDGVIMTHITDINFDWGSESDARMRARALAQVFKHFPETHAETKSSARPSAVSWVDSWDTQQPKQLRKMIHGEYTPPSWKAPSWGKKLKTERDRRFDGQLAKLMKHMRDAVDEFRRHVRRTR